MDLARVGAAPLYVVHLSSSPALAAVAAARAEGANVFAETCPQYLYLSIEDQGRRPAGGGGDVRVLAARSVPRPRAIRTTCGPAWRPTT